jgi:hypothetical protein
MAQSLKFSIRGLHSSNSDISGVPLGSLSVAKNIDLSKVNLAQCRRGFDLLGNGLPDASYRATKLFDYQSYIFGYYNSTLNYYNSGWSSVGALAKPANALVPRPVSLNQNLYITSSSGLKKLDSIAGQLYSAGIPSGLMMELTQSVGTGTAVPDGKTVAYRYFIGRYDANNNFIRGGVSGRETITASSADKNITVKGYIPTGLDNTYVVQLYRSGNSSGIPNDELQLVDEIPLTNTDISNGYFSYTDIIPETSLGATIYTAPSQETIVNDNAQPPLASDMCEFKQFLFFADTESKHRFKFTLISVYDGSGAGQLRNGDTITISDGTTTEVYTANSTAADVATKNFKVDVASSSLSTRIDNTIRSFISVVNQASALVYAYLTTTGDDDLPGGCRLEAKTIGGSAFTVVSSRQASFNPQLTTTATTSQTSTNDAYRNGLMFSKQGQPEAVPVKNLFRVGSSDDPIKRILPLRDSLLIFKARDGVYRLIGDNETNFSVAPLDSTAKIVAPESLVTLNGQIYGLFESGICTVSDTSVEVISDPIQDKIQLLYGQCLQEVKDYGFGIAYETDAKYILALPQASGDTSATYQLVYHVFNDNFWEWDLNVSAGYVSSTDGKLYFGSGSSSRVLKEFKSFTYEDFADYEQSCTLSSATGTTLVISGADHMSVGDLLSQTDLQPCYITAVDAPNNTVTVDLDQTWDTGQPVLHYKAIQCEIEWNPDFAGNPAGQKHYSSLNLMFNRSIIQNATVSFSSDTNPAISEVRISGPDFAGAWGYVAWGDGVWGGESAPAPTRIGVPKPNARCNSLTIKFSHRIAASDWQLSGLAADFNPVSTRTSR